MKNQHLSVGAFVNRLDPLEEALSRKGRLRHHFRLTSVFGTFPNVIFNGGRTLIHYCSVCGNEREWYMKKNHLWYDPQGMESLVRSYNDRGIGVRYTYSNSMITKRHLADERANLTLEIAHNPLNAVITGNPVIEQYVRKQYPRFRIISSATSEKNLSVAFLKKRIREVDLLVMPPEFNRRYGLIEKLGADKIEILINERCAPHCANRQAHYRSISRSQLELDGSFERKNYYSRCPVYRAAEKEVPLKTMELTDEDIAALQKLGVRNFKFAGRQLSRQEFVVEMDRMLVKDRFRMFKETEDQKKI
jgi:collagenase-like PrtC family protease